MRFAFALLVLALAGCTDEVATCEDHYVGCLNSPLGSRNDGFQTVCQSCYDICRGAGIWPVQSPSGRECRWWLYNRFVIAPDAAPKAAPDAGQQSP